MCVAGRLGADTDPAKIHAQDRLVAAQDTHLMVTDMIDGLIMVSFHTALLHTALLRREMTPLCCTVGGKTRNENAENAKSHRTD